MLATKIEAIDLESVVPANVERTADPATDHDIVPERAIDGRKTIRIAPNFQSCRGSKDRPVEYDTFGTKVIEPTPDTMRLVREGIDDERLAYSTSVGHVASLGSPEPLVVEKVDR